MHIKAFENFSMGKFGGKNKKDSTAEKDAMDAKIAGLEAKVSGKTRDLKKATEKLNVMKTSAGIEIPVIDVPVRPHGPVAELTLEPEDLQSGAGITLDEVMIDDSVKPGEEIKITEVTVAKVTATSKGTPAAIAVTPPVVETKQENIKEEKKEEPQETKPDDTDSLNNLFNNDEEEENPLASLINSLPDVTARELMDDLNEIHRIIKEWKPSSK